MPIPRQDHLTINTFKGVNLSDPSHVIDDKEFASIENLIISDTGDLIRRRPLRYFAEGSDQVACYPIAIWYNRLIWFHVNSQTLFMSQVNTFVGGTFKSQVLSDEIFNLGVLYNKEMYFFTATLPSIIKISVSSWDIDAPTLTETTFSVNACEDITCAVVFKDRLFVTKGVEEKTSDVAYSEIADLTNFPVNNILKVSPGDGDYITCIVPFGERLFIFKKYSTWVLIPAALPSSWVVKLFDNSIGAISENCVVEKRGLLYVLAPRGLYRSDGVIYDYVGYPVEARFRDNIGTLSAGSISLVDDDLFIRTNIASIGSWMYNPIQNAWTEQKFPTLGSDVLTVGRQGYLLSGKRRTWFGSKDILWMDLTDPDLPTNEDYSDYTLHNAVAGSRVITPIHTAFETKAWDNGNFFRTKRHKYSTIEITVPPGGSTDAEFHTHYNFDRALVSETHEFRVGLTERGTMAHKIPGTGYNRRLQLSFDTDTTLDYMITGYDLDYFNKRTLSENPE